MAVHNCVFPASHSGKCIPMTEADKLRNGEWAMVRKDDLRHAVKFMYAPNGFTPAQEEINERLRKASIGSS